MRYAIILCSALLLPTLANAKDRLHSGEQLGQIYTDSLMSPNGLYTLAWRSDQNGFAVFRADGSVRYWTANWGRGAIMQGDGNFVIYTWYDDTSPWSPVWSSGTGGRCPCPSPHYLRIWDDGNLTIDYGQIPQTAPYMGRIWELGKDSVPLTTTTGFEEPQLPPGSRPSYVPNPAMPKSYAY